MNDVGEPLEIGPNVVSDVLVKAVTESSMMKFGDGVRILRSVGHERTRNGGAEKRFKKRVGEDRFEVMKRVPRVETHRDSGNKSSDIIRHDRNLIERVGNALKSN